MHFKNGFLLDTSKIYLDLRIFSQSRRRVALQAKIMNKLAYSFVPRRNQIHTEEALLAVLGYQRVWGKIYETNLIFKATL